MTIKNVKAKGNLVRLLDMDPEFYVDLIYSTDDNFTGSKVYQSSECYIDKDTAIQLIDAKNKLKAMGYGVKIWDAYRPVSAQQRFWDLLPDNDYVAYPPDMATMTEFKNSHMNGQCVDVTLTNPDGSDIPMPSGFDDFSERAHLDYPGTTGKARENAETLRDVMVQCGFTPYKGEWWHFYNHNTTPVRYSDFEL
ncbi:M15 family metallopeptidase [Aminicella lysinilytica]|jgi:D-alanyl-D-alanine dipeptidase|uniref:M15 family metallopeptidase n=1 Tax=Aminicella lysinilytica TaxID=433323 RepID=UPI0026F1F4F0|nr:M15 family metallopeptidase [Aminicella lysinilytica]